MDLFLQRFPGWLRVQLEGMCDQDNIGQLTTRADRLFALHGHKQGGTIAMVENLEDPDEGAAINAFQGGRQRRINRRGQLTQN